MGCYVLEKPHNRKLATAPAHQFYTHYVVLGISQNLFPCYRDSF